VKDSINTPADRGLCMVLAVLFATALQVSLFLLDRL
jgi:hypothetical protein